MRNHSLGQPCGLAEHLAHRVAVKVTELAGGEHLLEIEHLKEVELQVTDIAFIVAHELRH